MRRSRDWLRRLAKRLGTGLVAVGQCLGSYTTPECYGFVPAEETRTVEETRPADGAPCPGHPERLIPYSALPAHEQVMWQQWEEAWQHDGTGHGFTAPPW